MRGWNTRRSRDWSWKVPSLKCSLFRSSSFWTETSLSVTFSSHTPKNVCGDGTLSALTFIVDGGNAVNVYIMHSHVHWNTTVPLVQILADVIVTAQHALERNARVIRCRQMWCFLSWSSKVVVPLEKWHWRCGCIRYTSYPSGRECRGIRWLLSLPVEYERETLTHRKRWAPFKMMFPSESWEVLSLLVSAVDLSSCNPFQCVTFSRWSREQTPSLRQQWDVLRILCKIEAMQTNDGVTQSIPFVYGYVCEKLSSEAITLSVERPGAYRSKTVWIAYMAST